MKWAEKSRDIICLMKYLNFGEVKISTQNFQKLTFTVTNYCPNNSLQKVPKNSNDLVFFTRNQELTQEIKCNEQSYSRQLTKPSKKLNLAADELSYECWISQHTYEPSQDLIYNVDIIYRCRSVISTSTSEKSFSPSGKKFIPAQQHEKKFYIIIR